MAYSGVVTALFEQPESDVINCPVCGARLELKWKGGRDEKSPLFLGAG
jgi:hypothetical protein